MLYVGYIRTFMGNIHINRDERTSYGRNYINVRLMINITICSSTAIKAELWKLSYFVCDKNIKRKTCIHNFYIKP
jgi:hypothetical protein